MMSPESQFPKWNRELARLDNWRVLGALRIIPQMLVTALRAH
jgi:hypothetical protein